MCQWIGTHLGDDVPLHFSRFLPAYKLIKLPPTPIDTLEKAWELARKAGLKYVTIGNVPGHVANSTYCPECGKMLIERVEFAMMKNHIRNGKCKYCDYDIKGVWA